MKQNRPPQLCWVFSSVAVPVSVMSASEVFAPEPCDSSCRSDGDSRMGEQTVHKIGGHASPDIGSVDRDGDLVAATRKYSAACPAELAPPITVTGLSWQSRASSSVAA